MARYLPPHPKKGSPEAFAWAARMRAARGKKRKPKGIDWESWKEEARVLRGQKRIRQIVKRELGNPGAAWHEARAEEAELEQQWGPSQLQQFFGGKALAHWESALWSRDMGMNPQRIKVGQAHTQTFGKGRGRKSYTVWAWYDPKAKVHVYGPRSRAPGGAMMSTADGKNSPYMVDLQTGEVFTDDPTWAGNPCQRKSYQRIWKVANRRTGKIVADYVFQEAAESVAREFTKIHGEPYTVVRHNPKPEHRAGYASPVYHPKTWPGWRVSPYERAGAKPLKKIRLPKGHPSGKAELEALKKGEAESHRYWKQVAEEMREPLAAVRITNPRESGQLQRAQQYIRSIKSIPKRLYAASLYDWIVAGARGKTPSEKRYGASVMAAQAVRHRLQELLTDWNPRRSRARYRHRHVADPRAFDPRSFRVIQTGKKKRIVACPKGAYSPTRRECTVGTRVQAVLTKKNPIAIYNPRNGKPVLLPMTSVHVRYRRAAGQHKGQLFSHNYGRSVRVYGNVDGSVTLRSIKGAKLWGA